MTKLKNKNMKNLKKLSRGELRSLKGGDRGIQSTCPAAPGCAHGGIWNDFGGPGHWNCCSAPTTPAPCGPCNANPSIEP